MLKTNLILRLSTAAYKFCIKVDRREEEAIHSIIRAVVVAVCQIVLFQCLIPVVVVDISRPERKFKLFIFAFLALPWLKP